MISFKQNDAYVELPKKLNVGPSNSQETIPNEDFHFYRFFIEDGSIEEDTPILPATEIILEEPPVQIPVTAKEETPEVQPELKPSTPKDLFQMLLLEPDSVRASFLDIKLWAILHMHFRTGVDYADLLTMRNFDLDLKAETFRIHLKNGLIASFPLHSDLIPVLSLYMQRRKGNPEDFLFCNEQGQELSLPAFHSQLQKLLNYYQLASFTNHELAKLYQELF